MKRSVRLALLSGVTSAVSLTTPSVGRAGCFDGWCCSSNKSAPAYPVGAPYPVGPNAAAVTPITPSNGGMSSYYGNYGMMPPSQGPFLPPGIPQTVVSAMPTAAYDTQWMRTPVTYYRPVTQFDPNYGTTVTSLQPCTSYQYPAHRVPMVAPAPATGPYAYESNQWPGVNAPGYFPTGVMPTAAPSMPVYPPVQQIPMAGMNYAAASPVRTSSYGAYANTLMNTPVPNGPMAMAPMTGATLPMTAAMPVAPAVSSAVYMGGAGSAVPAAAWSASPAVAGPTMIGPTVAGTGTPMYTSPSNPLNMTSAMPGTCLPGTCPPATAMSSAMPMNTAAPYPATQYASPSNIAPPNIPGATVIPVGPPTILNNPSAASPMVGQTGLPATYPSTSSVPSSVGPTPIYPGATLPSTGASTVVPGIPKPFNPGEVSPVLPPGANGNDPEANRVPSLGTNAGLPNHPQSNVAQLMPMPRLPLVEIDRSPTTEVRYPTSNASNKSPVALPNPFDATAANASNGALSLPPSPSQSVSPLAAPDSFDAAPRWNPKLAAPAEASPHETVAASKQLKSASFQRPVSRASQPAASAVPTPTFRPVTGP